MLRRIPIVPMLFGVFAAWTLLAMLASRDRSLSDTRIYVVAGAFGAAYILLVTGLLHLLPSPRSRAGSMGVGCLVTSTPSSSASTRRAQRTTTTGRP